MEVPFVLCPGTWEKRGLTEGVPERGKAIVLPDGSLIGAPFWRWPGTQKTWDLKARPKLRGVKRPRRRPARGIYHYGHKPFSGPYGYKERDLADKIALRRKSRVIDIGGELYVL